MDKINQNTDSSEKEEKRKISVGIDPGIGSLAMVVVEEVIEGGEEKRRILDSIVEVWDTAKNRKKNTKADQGESRRARNQRSTKKSRKKKLIQALADNGMLPLSAEEIYKSRQAWNRDKNNREPSSSDLIYNKFINQEVYDIRRKALENENLTPFEMGRVLLSFSERRGYPEDNRKNIDDPSEAKKLTGGDLETGQVGTNETQEAIEESEHPYLGYYFSSIKPKKGELSVPEKKIRGRYTYRGMYVAEFNQIWDLQKEKSELQSILTPKLKIEILDILFSQGEITIPKRGNCYFEKDKPVAYKCALLFEAFRCYKFVNNFRFEGEPLSGIKRETEKETEREKAIKYLHKKKFKIEGLKKALKKETSNSNYDFEKGEIPSMPVTLFLTDFFGKEIWNSLSDKEKNERWHIIFEEKNQLKLSKKKGSQLKVFDKNESTWFENYAKKNWGLTPDKIKKFDKLQLPKGTCSISEKAIKYLLPYLKKGFSEADSFILGTLKKAFGHNFSSENPSESKPNYWNTLSIKEKEKIENDAAQIIRKKSIPNQYTYQSDLTPIKNIIEYLTQKYPKKAYAPEKIDHHSNQFPEETQKKLPPPPEVFHSSLETILAKIRKNYNFLAEKHKIDLPRIVIENPRDFNVSEEKRLKIIAEQRKNQEKKDRIFEELSKILKDFDPERDIKKYRLWEESGHQCIYSGKNISFNDVFKDKNVEIEHIIPRNRKDSRFINLTLSFKKFNNKKGNRTPFEAFEEDEKLWNEIKQRAYKLLPYNKCKRILLEEKPEEVFLQGDLDLTGYIAKEMGKYLRHVTKDVQFAKGGITSLVVNKWNLNTLLSPILKMPPKQEDVDMEVEKEDSSATSQNKFDYQVGKYTIAVVDDEESNHIKPYKIVGYSRLMPEIADNEVSKNLNKNVIIQKELNYKKRNLNLKLNDKNTSSLQKKELKSELKEIEKKQEAITKEIIKFLKEETKISKQINEEEKKIKNKFENELKAHQFKKYRLIDGFVKVKNKDGEKLKPPIFIPQERKNRNDHRHHLIDALALATLRLSDLQEINKKNKSGEEPLQGEDITLTPPWSNFYFDVKKCLQEAVIIKETKNRLFNKNKRGGTPQGKLHEETFLSRHIDINEQGKEEECTHHRIEVEGIFLGKTFKQAEKRAKKIVDQTIREKIVLPALERHFESQKRENNKVNEGSKIKGNPFFEEVYETIQKIKKKKGKEVIVEEQILAEKKPLLFLQSKKGKVPILRIRIKEPGNTVTLAYKKKKVNTYVTPGNNHMMLFYASQEKWTYKVVTFWDAVKARTEEKNYIPEFDEEGNPFVFSLKKGDMVLLGLPSEKTYIEGALESLDRKTISKHLYRLKKISQNGLVVFIKHTSGETENLLSLVAGSITKENPIKVILRRDGSINYAIPPINTTKI